MSVPLISVMDIIQIALLLAACFACYVNGKIKGISSVINDLLDHGKITLKDLEEMYEQE